LEGGEPPVQVVDERRVKPVARVFLQTVAVAAGDQHGRSVGESEPAGGDRALADVAGPQMNLGDVAQPGAPFAAARDPGDRTVGQSYAVIGVGPDKALLPEAEVEIVAVAAGDRRRDAHPKRLNRVCFRWRA